MIIANGYFAVKKDQYFCLKWFVIYDFGHNYKPFYKNVLFTKHSEGSNKLYLVHSTQQYIIRMCYQERIYTRLAYH